MIHRLFTIAMFFALWIYPSGAAYGQRQMESLGRGVVASRTSSTQSYVGWRLLGTDPSGVSFNVYRSANGGAATKLNASPITATTDYVDSPNFSQTNAYTVRPVISGVEQSPSAAFTLPASPATKQYLSIPLQIPPAVTLPGGVTYSYSANDCSVGDLDGDGEYECIVKWDAASHDNSDDGYSGNVLLDAYKMDGTRLWRIDLGVNIRAGSHYTQFMVYDLDGDGISEIACKTAPGTLDGGGNYVGGAAKWQNTGGMRPAFNDTDDYRNSGGYILTGPEFLTIFDGQTGAEMVTTGYVPLRGTVADWGDNYGNRVDRFLACVAYLDGVRPSLVMCRGYYTRTALAAWDWRNGQLTQRWIFDTGHSGGPLAAYKGQGAHSLSVGDVDGDGKDEITYGACAIDDNGTGLYTTGLGHGDALHMSDMDPDRPGQEVFMVHEDQSAHGGVGGELRDARTGALLKSVLGSGDVGRGCAFDLEAAYPGYEMWTSSNSSIYNVSGAVTGGKPGNMFQNFGVWWDADFSRELMDGTTISDWVNGGRSNLDLDPAISGIQQSAPGCSSNNGTKSTPCLSADLFGDWREEVIWRTSDNTELRIFTTRTSASNRLVTLMHDPQYRLAIAWQNVGYNQPPHPGFYLGAGMSVPPRAPVWNGDLVWGGTPNATWDIGTTANWLTKPVDGTASTFLDGKSVLFSISGGNATVSLSGALAPSQVVVHNPVGKDYIFGGSGSLNGAMPLTKAGEGSLTIEGSHPFTGATKVQQGTLVVNGSLSASQVTVEGYGALGGSGTLGQAVTVNARGHISPGAGSGSAGTLTIGGPLAINGGTVDLDLAATAGGTHDRIAVQNNLTLSGTVTLAIHPLSGTIAPGTYTLATYTGTFTGSVSNLSVILPEGTPYTIAAGSGSITLTIPVTRAPGAVTWTGSASGVWDLAATANWNLGGSPAVFVSGDSLTFDDTGAARPAVTLNTVVPVSGITFSGSVNYTISGTGSISGSGGLNKTGNSTVTLNTANKFTGPVTVTGGVLAISTIANSGQPSSIGASSNSASNLTLNGGTLRIAGTDAMTDRSITLGAGGGVVDISSTLQLGGSITGTGAFTKAGAGTLILANANTHAGGTVLQAGTLVFSSDSANTSGHGTGGLTLQGGTLRMYDNVDSYNTSAWPIDVPAGASARFEADGRCVLSGPLTGSGTLEFYTSYIRTDLTGNWSAFAGTLDVTTDSDGGDFRLANSNGLAGATVNSTASVWAYSTVNSSHTFAIGALSGSGTFAGNSNAGRTVTWQIGGKNLSTTFVGTIQNGSGPSALTKTGTGTLTLTGAHAYTGATTVSSGGLILDGGSLSGTNVSVSSGAAFGGNGAVTGNVTFNSGSTLLSSPAAGPLAVTGNLTVNGAVTISPVFGSAPAEGTYTICTYTGTLTGSPVFTWSGTGYTATFDTTTVGQVKITLTVKPRDPADLVWTGATNAIWDTSTANWSWPAGATSFLADDRVRFDDTSEVNAVSLSGNLQPATITVDATQAYTLGGPGELGGTGTLTKTNTGDLTISPTLLALTSTTTDGSPAVTVTNAAGLVTGMTVTGTGIPTGTTLITINGTTLTLSQNATANGTPTLSYFSNHTYSGGSLLAGGRVVFTNSVANSRGLGTGKVTLNGGTLNLFSLGTSSTSAGTFPNALQVDAGFTGTLIGFGRGSMTGALTGDGTLAYQADYVRGDVNGNWSAFTGQINVTKGPNGGDFRINNTNGFGTAKINLGTNVTMYMNVNFGGGGLTNTIGELTGVGNLRGGPTSGRTMTWNIGGTNTNAQFDGTISNSTGATAITKSGSGTWTLTGASTYNGATSVSSGALLVRGSLGATVVAVSSGATIGGTGSLGGSLTLASGSKLALGVGSSVTKGPTVSGAATLNGAITVVPALLGGALAPGTYTLLTCSGTLGGSPTFTWIDTTSSGYLATFDTSTAGQVKITLIPPQVTPAAPSGLVATPGNAQIGLAWNAVSGATSYSILRSGISGSGYVTIASGLITTSSIDTGLTNGATYHYVVTAHNAAGSSGTSNEASAVPVQTYSQWAAAAFPEQTDPAFIDMNADPDNDGCRNLLEYFFGTSPGIPNVGGPVTCALDGQGYIILSFRMSKNLSNIGCIVEQSTNLSTWENSNVTPVMMSDQGTYLEMRATVPQGAHSTLVLRLRVTGQAMPEP